MPYTKSLPEWHGTGTKPPQSKLNSGWVVGEKPPADWWNWFNNTTYQSIKELQENALHIEKVGVASGIATLGTDGKVPTSQLPAATAVSDGSTTNKGIVQLNDTTNSTLVTQAATANAVKKVADIANGKYTKPSSGVPKTDLETSVQNSLTKADSAITSIPVASSTTAGITKLNDTLASTSTTEAATANSVKAINDTINNHKNDYQAHLLYNATTGPANTYVLTPSLAIASYAAIEGVPVGIKINATNTGPSTINISGKGAVPILNSKGNQLPAGTLKTGVIYTLRYNGTSFFLQGEGGSGNAQASDVASGKTFTNDTGEQTGTGTMDPITTFTAGTNYLASSSATVSTASLSYIRLKEIKANKPGTVRVSFDLSNAAGIDTGQAKIYVNGTPIGTERTSTSSLTTFSEDISVMTGDLVQIYAKTLNINFQSSVQNLKIGVGNSLNYFTINI